jgi:DNA-binding CsgD family transcriptional regulator
MTYFVVVLDVRAGRKHQTWHRWFLPRETRCETIMSEVLVSRSRPERAHADARFVDETLQFVARMTRVRAIAFYVIDRAADHCTFRRLGVPETFHREYKAGMCKFDPFEYHRLEPAAKGPALLSRAVSQIPTPEERHYVHFVQAHGYEDVIETNFWSDGRLLGGISYLLDQGDDASEIASVIDAMNPYIEYNLRGFSGRTKSELRSDLAKSFSLSPRELDVVELLMSGQTNSAISEALYISVATVKSHVLKIFEKAGVPNRASLVSLLSEYQAH